jgi:hypothetical protein
MLVPGYWLGGPFLVWAAPRQTRLQMGSRSGCLVCVYVCMRVCVWLELWLQ